MHRPCGIVTDNLRAEENVLNKIQENFPDDSTQTAAPASVYRKIYFRGLDPEHMKSMAASHDTNSMEAWTGQLSTYGYAQKVKSPI